MSRASKITLGLSCLFTVTTVIGVHIIQDMERETLHQGPIKDAKRMADKKNGIAADPQKERKKLFNQSEHEMQQELRKKFESQQPLSGEILTKDGEVVEK
ncbi:LAFE_0B05116g1_1 [Lachancea fermentati]|uniref:LAFE_0B05116g1_1 n=1 Tax=Lachancea fermentati TaxID=4955 RepID=A0A1G4M7W9_LACFM|nr:LAFE_0B05116g1_1 [Lachancea fermentati]